MPKDKIVKKGDGGKARRPLFQLEDPRPPMIPGPPARRYAKHGPRVWTIGPTEPIIAAIFAAQFPKIDPRPEPKPAPVKDGKVSANSLLRRLQAIMYALKNLDKEAVRLVKRKARRQRILTKRMIHVNPLRHGRPPYLPEKSRHEVEDILRDCHWLAWEATSLDTS